VKPISDAAPDSAPDDTPDDTVDAAVDGPPAACVMTRPSSLARRALMRSAKRMFSSDDGVRRKVGFKHQIFGANEQISGRGQGDNSG
jgi:hypothetical protein